MKGVGIGSRIGFDSYFDCRHLDTPCGSLAHSVLRPSLLVQVSRASRRRPPPWPWSATRASPSRSALELGLGHAAGLKAPSATPVQALVALGLTGSADRVGEMALEDQAMAPELAPCVGPEAGG